MAEDTAKSECGAPQDAGMAARRLERELRERLASDDELFSFFQGDVVDGVWFWDLEQPDASWVSAGFWRALGYPGAPSVSAQQWRELLHPDDVGVVERNFARHCADPNHRYEHTVRYRRVEGGYARILSRGKALRDGGGRPLRMVGTHCDLTRQIEIREALEAAEAAASASERRLRLAIEAIPDGFVIYDAEDRLVLCNEQYRSSYHASAHRIEAGVSFEEILRAGLAAGQYPEAAGREEAWLAERLQHHRNPRGAIEQELPGERFLKIHERRTENGDTVGFRVDITEIKRQQRRLEDYAKALEAAQSELERQALHDALTGLPNRRRLDEHLAHLREALSGSDRRVALLHVDLDRFKQINDALGHAMGDHVLRHAADILRTVAAAGDLVARIGGDEFVLVRTFGGDVSEIEALAQTVVEAMARPTVFEGRSCRYGASVGVADAAGAALDPAQLLIDADIAVARAKAGGRNRVARFSPALQTAVVSQKRLADEILRGVEQGEFIPFYQPQFSAVGHDFVGVEALARWRHPERGVLAPVAFLKTAEEIGALEAIDGAILDAALRDMARLEARGLVAPKLSVNVTAARLRNPALVERMAALPPSRTVVAFELLESIFLDGDDAELMWSIDRLKECGVEIEIDDFGSGRASIVGLTKVGPKRLKIDRQIVTPMAEDPAQCSLVSAIIEIGRALGVDVTAEGVETAEHARLLAEMGCSTLQGFHFSKPQPFDGLEQLLRAESWRRAS